jgi:hypothetical protein
MTMLKHFSPRLYRRPLLLLAMKVNMAELKRAPFVRQPLLLGCKSGITGTACKALSQSRPATTLAIDVSEQTIERPVKNQKAYYSGKNAIRSRPSS